MNPKDLSRIDKALLRCKTNPKEWFPSRTVIVKVNVPRDEKGNPRYGWMILSCRSGDLIDFIDDRSRRHPKRHSRAVTGPTIDIGPREFELLKKEGSMKPAIGCVPCGRKKLSRR